VAFEWQARCFLLTLTSEVQGERRAELAQAMLSRSLHSRCISNALQRYYIPVAVYEYFTRNFYFFCDYFSFPDFVGRMCCSVDFRRQLLALGIAQASSALLSLLQLLQCCSSLKGISIP
jgi:hypothetical protein